MTKTPEMSVMMSMKARGSSGLVGRPALGSTTRRTAATVGRPQLAPVVVNIAVSLTPGIRGEHVGLEVLGVKEVVLEELTRAVRFGVELDRQRAVRAASKARELVLQSRWQEGDVAAGHDRGSVGGEVRIAVARRGVLRRVPRQRSRLRGAPRRQRLRCCRAPCH